MQQKNSWLHKTKISTTKPSQNALSEQPNKVCPIQFAKFALPNQTQIGLAMPYPTQTLKSH